MDGLTSKINVPSGVSLCADALRNAGGRPYLVGGAVRDSLLDRPLKDYDLEVFGLSAAAVAKALSPFARVEPAGDAFPENS